MQDDRLPDADIYNFHESSHKTRVGSYSSAKLKRKLCNQIVEEVLDNSVKRSRESAELNEIFDSIWRNECSSKFERAIECDDSPLASKSIDKIRTGVKRSLDKEFQEVLDELKQYNDNSSPREFKDGASDTSDQIYSCCGEIVKELLGIALERIQDNWELDSIFESLLNEEYSSEVLEMKTPLKDGSRSSILITKALEE